MELPSILDVSDSDAEDGEVELFMPSQAYKYAPEVEYARLFDSEHLNDALGSPTFHGRSPGGNFCAQKLVHCARMAV